MNNAQSLAESQASSRSPWNKATVLRGQSAPVDLIQPAHESRPIHRVQAARKSRLANGFYVTMPRKCYAAVKVALDFDG